MALAEVVERHGMSDEDKEDLEDRIVDKLMKRIYADIGRSFVKKLFWIGVAVLVVLGIKFGIIKGPTG